VAARCLPATHTAISSRRPDNLKHAFEIIVHSYKLQKEALEANRRRWGDERQDLLTREQNLAEALSAVREALDAETQAHDKDLETLEMVMARNSELEQQVRTLHKRVSGERAGADVGAPQLATSVLSSSLSVLAGVPVQQRYDAETDSYKLVERASVDDQEMKDSELETRHRAANTATLAKEVSLLRQAYVDLQGRIDEGRRSGGAEGCSDRMNAKAHWDYQAFRENEHRQVSPPAAGHTYKSLALPSAAAPPQHTSQSPPKSAANPAAWPAQHYTTPLAGLDPPDAWARSVL
jgi:hypothetical protein